MSGDARKEFLAWYNRFSIQAELKDWNLVWVTDRPQLWASGIGFRIPNTQLICFMTGRSELHKEARRLLRTYSPEEYQACVQRLLELKVQE